MQKTGVIEALNISPKGFCEGVLLKSGATTIQLNLPKEESPRWDGLLTIGDTLCAEVEPEDAHGHPAHKVFRSVRLMTLNGKAFAGGNEFSGRVERLNYARHGEVNGGILDCGDFLHLKPEGARLIKIKVGMKVSGSGTRVLAPGGKSVIEAEEVNGLTIRHKQGAKKAAPKKATKAAK